VLPFLFIARRAWRALAGMTAVAAGLALLAVLLSGPASIAGYLGLVLNWATGNNQAWPIAGQTVYSLRGLLETMPGGRLPALAVLLVLLLLTALALSWRPDKPRLDFALALAASVALSPYQNLHDLSLLVIPGFMLADLAVAGEVRHPRASLVVLGLAYLGMTVTLVAGTQTAALGAIALAAMLLVERLSVGPEPVPLGELKWSGPRPRRVIVLPAYKAARTVKDVVDGIPAGSADRILLVDDASSDATVSVATALHLDVIRHERNLGYGGNQKTCYRTALEMGADVIVMLHPDNQYDPTIVPKLCEVIERGDADIVLGSRWLGIDPARAGMPRWKRWGNRFLTHTENRVLGLSLSEYHTGYRAYSRRFLEAIPFLENSNDFVFDTQVLVQAAAFGFRIGEVPAVGRYFEEMSSIGFRTSAVYGLKTLAALLRYILHRAGFPARWLTPRVGAVTVSAAQASSFSR
jgi:glycosyl transferase family 2/glycosyl transferase family 87